MAGYDDIAEWYDEAVLKVNADNASKSFGDPDPALTYKLGGFKNGENETTAGVNGEAACSLDGSAGPNAGLYTGAITCAPGNLTAQNYSFATGTQGNLEIIKANQTINFGALADKTYGDENFAVSAKATSGLPVSFSADGACSVNQNGVVSITGAGGCTITASQAGNGNYNAAQSVPQSFQIAKAQARSA